MAAAKTGRKQPSIRTLWAIAKSPELHLSDEDLHAVVYRETHKESMKQLTQGEINTVARVLQNMKDSVNGGAHTKRTDEGGEARTVELRRKIYMLAKELGWSPAQVNGLAKRMFGVDRQEWLNPSQSGRRTSTGRGWAMTCSGRTVCPSPGAGRGRVRC